MVDYGVYEQQIVAIMMTYPQLFSRTNVSLINDTKNLEIISLTQTIYKNTGGIADTPNLRAYGYIYSPINPDVVAYVAGLGEEKAIDLLYKSQQQLQNRDLTKRLDKDMATAKRLLEVGMVNEAVSLLKNSQFTAAQDLAPTITHMISAMYESNGFATGVKEIDDKTGGLLLGNLMTIIGDSGSMKTMVSLWLVIQILRINPTFKCLYFEKEMPVKDIARRLISYMLNINTQEIMRIANLARTGNTAEMDQVVDSIVSLPNNKEAYDILERLLIVPAEDFYCAADIFRFVDQYRPQIWVLDFFTMLGDGAGGGRAEELYPFFYNEADRIKSIVQQTNTLGIVLAQIKQNAVRNRVSKIPRPDDAEFGSKLFQYSAYMFATFNPMYYYTEKFVEDKSRFYLVGIKNRHEAPPTVTLRAKPAICSFTETVEDARQADMAWINGYQSREK